MQSRKRFPKEGKIIVTAKGEEKVMLNDIFHDRVTLRAPDGESRVLTLVELRRETSASGRRQVERSPDWLPTAAGATSSSAAGSRAGRVTPQAPGWLSQASG